MKLSESAASRFCGTRAVTYSVMKAVKYFSLAQDEPCCSAISHRLESLLARLNMTWLHFKSVSQINHPVW